MPRPKLTELTPHGKAQEQRILDALAVRPMCNNELAAHLGMGRTGAAKYTARMLAASPKRLHIVGHHAPQTGGYPRPRFGPGDGVDVPYIATFPRTPKKEGDRKGDALFRIVKALEKGGTAKEMAKACHLAFTTVHKYMDEIHAAGWTIYIKRWKQTGARNAWCPVYASGNRPDAPRPPMQTRAERYQAERADPNKVKRHEDGRRLGRLRRQLRAKPAGIFAALGL